eukprot:2666766-Rhodomonas_salina.1
MRHAPRGLARVNLLLRRREPDRVVHVGRFGHRRLQVRVCVRCDDKDTLRRHPTLDSLLGLLIRGHMHAVRAVSSRQRHPIAPRDGAARRVLEPELDAAQHAVVEDDDEEVRLVLHGRAQLVHRHLEPAVARDHDGLAVRPARQRGGDAGAKCVAHRSQPL